MNQISLTINLNAEAMLLLDSIAKSLEVIAGQKAKPTEPPNEVQKIAKAIAEASLGQLPPAVRKL
jgi:hypothetical protein